MVQEATKDTRMATMGVAKRILEAGFWVIEVCQIDCKNVCDGLAIGRSSLWIFHDSAWWMMDNHINERTVVYPI